MGAIASPIVGIMAHTSNGKNLNLAKIWGKMQCVVTQPTQPRPLVQRIRSGGAGADGYVQPQKEWVGSECGGAGAGEDLHALEDVGLVAADGAQERLLVPVCRRGVRHLTPGVAGPHTLETVDRTIIVSVSLKKNWEKCNIYRCAMYAFSGILLEYLFGERTGIRKKT